MTTQLEEAKQCVQCLIKDPLDRLALKMLEDTIVAAQNPPPQGAADGSIEEEDWFILRDTATAFRKLQQCLQAFDQMVEEATTTVK